tara:strand:+ start:393 stop:1241 length:849 start_codon:yes stop_codon:yes gene_type:complete
MVDRSEGRKKSNFIAKTTVTAGSYCDFWVNNANYQISYSDFVSGLGVTGSMAQAGAVTAAPILNIDGTVNNIRGIENGSGVQANVSATDGVALSHSFTVDTTGQPIMQNTTATSPTFPSLVAGSGITVATSGATIVFTASEATNYAQSYMQANATATTIAATVTPVLVAGTWTVDTLANFTGTTAGRLTYTGTTTATKLVTATLTIEISAGTNQKVSVYIAKNGAVLAGSRQETDISAASVLVNMSCSFNVSLATNDYIEVFVQNATGTNDLVVSRIVFGAD